MTVICNIARLCMAAKYQFRPRHFFTGQPDAIVNKNFLLPLWASPATWRDFKTLFFYWKRNSISANTAADFTILEQCRRGCSGLLAIDCPEE
jgi:hypothetical protein